MNLSILPSGNLSLSVLKQNQWGKVDLILKILSRLNNPLNQRHSSSSTWLWHTAVSKPNIKHSILGSKWSNNDKNNNNKKGRRKRKHCLFLMHNLPKDVIHCLRYGIQGLIHLLLCEVLVHCDTDGRFGGIGLLVPQVRGHCQCNTIVLGLGWEKKIPIISGIKINFLHLKKAKYNSII